MPKCRVLKTVLRRSQKHKKISILRKGSKTPTTAKVRHYFRLQIFIFRRFLLTSQLKPENYMYRIPRIACNSACPASVEAAFAQTQAEKLTCNNWPDSYPYSPDVSFRIFHTGKELLLRFDVDEWGTAARTLDDNGPVWTDSCVEFFFRPEAGGHYYNFETNGIGTLLLGRRRSREDAEHAPADVLRQIRRQTTLPYGRPIEMTGDNRWQLTLVIPVTALYGEHLESWDGLQGSMNLYKCGDALARPHYLSWRPITAPRPDFHRPEFFESVLFEPKNDI